MNFASFAVNTLSTTMVYALFAMAVVFAYRTSRILFFCVGEIGAVSAYVMAEVWGWSGQTAAGLPIAILATLAVDVAAGLLLFFILSQEKQEDPFVGTAITIAIAIILVGLMSVIWGSSVEQLPLVKGSITYAGATIPLVGLVAITVGALTVLTTLALFYWTSIGVELQAVAENRQLAMINGIPVGRRMLMTWVGACILCGIGAVLSGAVSAISVESSAIGFSGIVAAIIGGLTSPGGALVGALMLATGENLISLFFDVRYSTVVPVVFLLVLLMVRPWGLSSRVERIFRT
ncbi:branched-chain amino acid ABC transporter permease [Hyphomicrobium sp. MC1]|uniref:branched-chain amino acid ABC transporter permease n=1 Tax=Hyphomicrobium sp. (strain MC1) TaxID=717785 RepID=UPI000213E921|nr:branched-chain amino acid ABC transporter permease [Hyphomicrobium sp. MC1]CCB66589.1 Inner-membrane translocator [Hyphomicrobium sp. MC1]